MNRFVSLPQYEAHAATRDFCPHKCLLIRFVPATIRRPRKLRHSFKAPQYEMHWSWPKPRRLVVAPNQNALRCFALNRMRSISSSRSSSALQSLLKHKNTNPKTFKQSKHPIKWLPLSFSFLSTPGLVATPSLGPAALSWRLRPPPPLSTSGLDVTVSHAEQSHWCDKRLTYNNSPRRNRLRDYATALNTPFTMPSIPRTSNSDISGAPVAVGLMRWLKHGRDIAYMCWSSHSYFVVIISHIAVFILGFLFDTGVFS